MATLRKPASAASIASSEFEEIRFEDFGPAPSTADTSSQPAASETLASETSSHPPPSDSFSSRYLPASSGLSSIFGKTRSVPPPPAAAPAAASAASADPRQPAAEQQDAPAPAPVQAAAPSEREEPAGGSAPQDNDPFREFEAATQKLGVAARDAASQIFGGADPKTAFSRLAGDVSSWWATLDPGASTATPSSGQAAKADECHTVFGLDASDELMEDFVASLAQTYACAHNSLTPSREVVFPGKLYITSRHLCFASPADKVTAVVPLAEVAKASVAGKHLAVTLKDGSTLALTGFQAGRLNEALGLLEHLSQPQ